MLFHGMEPLSDDDPNSLAFEAGGYVVDLRSRYSLVAIELQVERGEVRFLLFGEGSLRQLRVLGSTNIHLPAELGPVALRDDSSLLRPDEFVVSRWSAPEPERRWVTFATDGDIALSVLGSALEFGRVPDRDETVAPIAPREGLTEGTHRPDRSRENGWILQPGPVTLNSDETWVLSQVMIDAINRIVRVAVRSEHSRAHLEFQDVTSYRINRASTTIDQSARIGRDECEIVGLNEPFRDSHASDPRTFSVSTSGGLEFSLTASVQLSWTEAQQ